MGSRRTNVKIESFADAEAFLGDKPTRRYPVGKVTWIQRLSHTTIGVLYHRTLIVVYDSNGMITLNTGGWFTVTTKAKMNAFCPNGVRVYSSLGKWYVSVGSWDLSKTYDYADGMHIYPSGQVMINEGPSIGYQPAPEADERMDRAEYRRGRRFLGRRAIPSNGEDRVWQRGYGTGVCQECCGNTYGYCNTCGRGLAFLAGMERIPSEELRDSVNRELDRRDALWRAAQMRKASDDPQSAAYVPEFARGKGKA